MKEGKPDKGGGNSFSSFLATTSCARSSNICCWPVSSAVKIADMSTGAGGGGDEEDEAGGSSGAVLPSPRSSVIFAGLLFFAADAAEDGDCGGVGVPVAARSLSSMSCAMAMMAFADGAAVRGETRGDTVDVLPVVNVGSEPEDDKEDEEELLAIEDRNETQVVRKVTVAEPNTKENVSVGDNDGCDLLLWSWSTTL